MNHQFDHCRFHLIITIYYCSAMSFWISLLNLSFNCIIHWYLVADKPHVYARQPPYLINGVCNYNL